MARIGVSYWGFCEKESSPETANTPDGQRFGRPILFDELIAKGHTVYSLQERREKIPYPGIEYHSQSFPDIDVLFVEWRFPTYKNAGPGKFEPDLDRQTELLEHYHGNIPVVLWDIDYKITHEDEKLWSQAIIVDPAYKPKQITRSRQRLMFWSDWKTRMEVNPSPSFDYGYVGNNYEREEMFCKYYSKPSAHLRGMGIQTRVNGNWLQVSPEREHPKYLITKHPHIAFGHRLNFDQSMQVLNRFIATTHITKPDYAQCGLVANRYLENIAYSVPALVPHEFAVNDILGSDWVVSSSTDVIKKVIQLSEMSYDERVEVVESQKYAMKEAGLFDVAEAVTFIESLI